MIVNIISEDNLIHQTIEVTHMDGNTNEERFNAEWYGCLDGVKDLYPDSWSLSDLKDAMMKAGWTMQEIITLEVGY